MSEWRISKDYASPAGSDILKDGYRIYGCTPRGEWYRVDHFNSTHNCLQSPLWTSAHSISEEEVMAIVMEHGLF